MNAILLEHVAIYRIAHIEKYASKKAIRLFLFPSLV